MTDSTATGVNINTGKTEAEENANQNDTGNSNKPREEGSMDLPEVSELDHNLPALEQNQDQDAK